VYICAEKACAQTVEARVRGDGKGADFKKENKRDEYRTRQGGGETKKVRKSEQESAREKEKEREYCVYLSVYTCVANA